MNAFLHAHQALCFLAIRLLLRLALAVDDHRQRLPRRVRRWRGSLRRLYGRWLVRHGFDQPRYQHGHHPWNRTPEHTERQVVRLHVEQRHLGTGQLRHLAARVLGFHAARGASVQPTGRPFGKAKIWLPVRSAARTGFS